MKDDVLVPPRRRVLAALTIGLLASLLLGTVLAVTPAAAATGTYLRLARLSPGTAAADVYFTSVADPGRQYLVPGMEYGEISDYRQIEPGIYTVAARPAGAPVDSPPMLSTTVEAVAGNSYTVVGLEAPAPMLRVLTDDLGPPPPGQTRLRVIPGVPSAPRLDVAVDGGPEVGTGLELGAPSAYLAVPSGPVTLRVTAGPGRVESLPVQLPPDAVATVLVLEREGKLQTTVSVDARGPGTVPNGGIATGRGGASGSGAAGPSAVAWLLVGTGLVGGLAALRTRRRST